MRRRDFIGSLIVTATTLRRANAQQPGKVYHIAMVVPNRAITDITEKPCSQPCRHPFVDFFVELRRLGYVEGQTLLIDRYSGEGRVENYGEMARDVVRRNPDVICVLEGGIALLPVFKTATRTIPIVGVTGFPVHYGIAASLAHPGGNITGIEIEAGPGIMNKRLETLREAVPGMSRAAILATRGYGTSPSIAALREASLAMRVPLIDAVVEPPFDESEYRRVFATIASQGVEALIVLDDAVNATNYQSIVALAKENRLAAIYPYRLYVDAGGLMAYTIDFGELHRHMADQIGLILKGTSPAEIPFYQPSRYSLIINLKAARSLGLTIPSSLLAQGDEVIE